MPIIKYDNITKKTPFIPEYNADNRPISFTKTEGENTTLIECGYDYMGRRCIKKITVNGVITLHQRYIYRGYLQIACVDLTRSGHPGLWLITWDPTQPTATRPLAIQKNGTWYTCGHDLTKNVTELYNTNGTIATAYDYTPFGQVTATGTADQPIQWSSEFNDTELGLVYYNYRHYNPADGRWINRDPLQEEVDLNLYLFFPFVKDSLGKQTVDTLTAGAIQGLAAGEIAAVAKMMGFTSVAAFIKAMQKNGYKLECNPCKPPVGSQRQQCHDVKDGHKKHNKWPIHYHIFTVNQSPVPGGCWCFDKRTTVQNDPGFPPYEGHKPQGGGIKVIKM